MAENDARQRLDLDIEHRVALRLGKVAHLCLREPDVLQIARADLGDQRLDLVVAQAITVGAVVVEFLRHLAHGRIAARLDVLQRRLDGGAHGCVVLGALGFGLALFQMGHGHFRFLMQGGAASAEPSSKCSQPWPSNTSRPSWARTWAKSTDTQLSAIRPSSTFQKSM